MGSRPGHPWSGRLALEARNSRAGPAFSATARRGKLVQFPTRDAFEVPREFDTSRLGLEQSRSAVELADQRAAPSAGAHWSHVPASPPREDQRGAAVAQQRSFLRWWA